MNTGAALAAPPTAPRIRRAWERWLSWVEQPGRETLAVTVFFLLLTLAVFGPILIGPANRIIGDDGTDLKRQFIHWRAFGFGQMAAGHLPLWNPHIYGGTPYLGGFQSALLYPPNWLYICLPLTLAINSGIALHVFLAGWFTYFWVRHRGIHPVAAVLAGVLFMFSGPYFLHIFAGHLPNLCAMVWGPLILLAIDGWFDRRTVPWLLLGAGALTMQILAGHPQYVFYTGVAAALYGATKLWRDPQRLRMAAGLISIPVAAVAMSAAQLFEGFHATAESLRGKGTLHLVCGELLVPAGKFHRVSCAGLFSETSSPPRIGVAPNSGKCVRSSESADACWQCTPACRRDARAFGPAWGIAAALLVLASGRFTPLFEPLYHYAPGFNKFRGWSKFIYPATLFLVMLAAIGLDALLRRGSSSRVLAVVMTGGAACLFSAGFWAGWSAHVGSLESPRPWDDWLQTLYYSGDSMKWNAQILDPPGVQAAATFADHALLLAASTLLLLAAVFFAGRRWPQAV